MTTPPMVVLDVMGGDDAPGTALRAAGLLAAAGDEVRLCGPADVVQGHGLPVLIAPHWVRMDEDPVAALRARPAASIRVAARAVATGAARALVSAGPTGATVAAARLELGRQPGIRRPALGARIPVGDREVLLLDVGARPDADATNLVRHARLGIAAAQGAGVAAPTVGLLNMGGEAHVGPPRVREAAARLRDLPGFRGSVEPDGVLAGAVDVVVTDGFTGNILLKAIEACTARGPLPAQDSAATLLGVRGTVLVAHGAASAEQLAQAVRTATRAPWTPIPPPGTALTAPGASQGVSR